MRLYEALFLVESGRAATDWEGTEGVLLGILEKHGGEVRQKAFYEERKLAYPVKGARRGAYLLVHFDAEPPAIQEIHGDLNLTDAALRTMITVVEGEELPEFKAIGNTDPSTPKTREQREAERAEATAAAEARAAERAAAEKAAEEKAAEEKAAEEKAEDEKTEEKAEETPAAAKPADEAPAAETEKKEEEQA
jgi:ribosomal protein S6